MKDILPVPGNVPKQFNCNSNVCTQKHKWCNLTHFDNDNSKMQTIFAYPLTKEDKETSKMIESPPIKYQVKKGLTQPA